MDYLNYVFLVFIIFITILFIIVFIKKKNNINKSNFDYKNERIKTAFQLFSGIFFVLTFAISIITYNQTDKRDYSNRYSEGIKLLSNPNYDIRIGGMYSLEKLGIESQDYSSQISKVLCSYIQNNSPNIINDTIRNRSKISQIIKSDTVSLYKIRNDIQIAFNVIGELKKLKFNNDIAPEFFDVDIRGIDLRGLNFDNSIFYRSIINEANFDYSEMENCQFVSSKLVKCEFGHAILRKSKFSNCFIDSCDFVPQKDGSVFVDTSYKYKKSLNDVEFIQCDFNMVKFNGVDMENSFFSFFPNYISENDTNNIKKIKILIWNSNLKNSIIEFPDLSAISFYNTNLNGVYLNEVIYLKNLLYLKDFIDEKTMFRSSFIHNLEKQPLLNYLKSLENK